MGEEHVKVLENCNWNINTNKAQKVIDIVVEGTFSPEKAQEFIKDYQKSVMGLRTDEYTLNFDCRKLNLVKRENVQDLEECYKLYKETGFLKVIFEIEESAVLKMQLNRLARNTGLTNAEVVEVKA